MFASLNRVMYSGLVGIVELSFSSCFRAIIVIDEIYYLGYLIRRYLFMLLSLEGFFQNQLISELGD